MCASWTAEARSLGHRDRQARLPGRRQCRDCPVGQLGFCASLSMECRECLSKISQQDFVPAGEIVGKQGEPAETLIAITKGAMALTRRSPAGDTSVVGFRYPGELVMPHEHDFRWPVTIQALCSSQTCWIRFAELPRLSGHDREFTDRLLDVAAEQLAESFQHVLLLAYKEVHQRLAWFLLDFAARTHGGRVPRHSIELPMTRNHIANYIGVRTETVCRALGRLKARNLITVTNRRRIEIVDKRALANLAKGGRSRSAAEAQCIS